MAMKCLREIQQIKIYDSLGERVVQSVMKGLNATIFMYGQTGSAKTHTNIGKKTDPGSCN